MNITPLLQHLLTLLGFAIPDAEAAQGELGPGTRAALNHFQALLGLPAHGEPDAETVNALFVLTGQHLLTVLGFEIRDDEVWRATPGDSTVEATRRFQEEHGNLEITGELDDRTREALQERAGNGRFSAAGLVADAAGHPLAEGLVQAWDQDPANGARHALGRSRLAADGSYRLEYTHLQLRELGKLRADLVLVALDAAGAQRAQVGPIPRAPAHVQADLVVELAPAPAAGSSRLVAGVVRRADQQPFPAGEVRAFHQDERGLLRLGSDITDSAGRYTIRYAMLPGAESINLLVTASRPDGETLGEAGPLPNAGPMEFVDLQLPPVAHPPAVETPTTQRSLQGRVIFENGLPAEGITLHLYQQVFGGDRVLLATAVTQPHGLYALPFSTQGNAAGLEVRAVDAAGNEVTLSKALHDLGEAGRALVNLVAPSSLVPQPTELDRLAADLAPHVGDLANLANVREDGERQDLTLLNRATGWDARLVALAATATALSADPQVGLPQPALYGLLRLGLPSDPLQLAQVSPEVLDQALATAVEAGVVALDVDLVAETRERFARFSRQARLAVPAPGSSATYAELLAAAGVGEAVQERFAEVFLAHRDDPARLWEQAAAAGIAESDILTLQRQGKLAYLTTNSAALTTHLQQAMEITDPVQLVDQDLYEPEAWHALINRAAGLPANATPAQLSGGQAKRLRAAIPPAFAAADLAESRDAFAADMARRLRLSYPTQVVRRLVERDVEDRFALGQGREPVLAFLRSDAGQAFHLGETPVEPYFQSLSGGVAPQDAGQVQATKQTLKALQRVYQVTPSNEAMSTLMQLGLTSAHDITAMPRHEFVERYLQLSPSPQQAELIYRKAEQIDAVSYNLFTIARKLDSQPPVAVISAPAEVRQAVRDSLVKQFPTLESLFGSLDFCECEHCRSVLSPAAYLVDLLQFLDQSAEAAQDGRWAERMQSWPANHHGATYPFRNLEEQERYLERWRRQNPGQPDPDTRRTPYEVLIERRPDLPHIPLTCENTNTTLPTIDIANEIMEYYVAHEKLEAQAARDTGEATAAELLAEPQNLIPDAYDKLRKALYPLSLPFDLPLQTVRQFCDYFEAPLWRLLETFRPGDALFDPTQPYDRFAILVESLGLSPRAAALFTATDPLANWFELYGFASAGDATTPAVDPDSGQRIDLNSAKALSRRLGLTYKELVEVLCTGFVNPHLASQELPPRLDVQELLHKLDVTIDQVLAYQEDRALLAEDPQGLAREDQQRRLEAQAFEDRLARVSKAFPEAPFQAWLDGALQDNAFADILMLADTSPGCDFDHTELRYADRRPADGFAFLKINLFVRLWRQLGWSIPEVDQALQAFIPTSTPFEPAHLAQAPLRTALVYLAHLQELEARLRPGKEGRSQLVTLWAPIPTRGKDSLYARLFLSRRLAAFDPVFDHPLGEYLAPAYLATVAGQHWFSASQPGVAPAAQVDPAPFAAEPRLQLSYDPLEQVQHLSYQGVLTSAEKDALLALAADPLLPGLLDQVQAQGETFTRLQGHLPAVQGTLGLTAGEVDLILQDAGLSLASAGLSLETLSLLYRTARLAAWMRLPVADLLTLRQLSGLDPFHPLDDQPLASLEQDAPFTHTLAFLDIAAQVKASGLGIEDLDYLLRHRFDATGKYRPDQEGMLALLKTLAESVRSIRAEHALPADASALGDEVLHQKLGLALPPDVVQRLLLMLSGAAEFTAVVPGVAEDDAFPAGAFATVPAIVEVRHNPARQERPPEQSLTYRGVLSAARQATLEAQLNAGLSPAQQAVLTALLTSVRQQARAFFDRHLRQGAPGTQPAHGFLDAADFDLLFDPDHDLGLAPDLSAEEAAQKRDRGRRARLAGAFLPFLQMRLIRQTIVQALVAQAGADPALVESLLTDARLLAASPGPEPRALLDVVAGAAERGLTASFFTTVDPPADGAAEPLAPPITVAAAATGPLPAGARSARLEGYLEVPEPGAYRFYVRLDRQDARAVLRFAHLPAPTLAGTASQDGDEAGQGPAEYAELKPGSLYRFTLDLHNLAGGGAQVLVQGETLPKGSLGRLPLYPKATLDSARRGLTLLAKALQLLQSLGLSEREARTLLTHPEAFGNLDLSQLPAEAIDDTPAGAQALFRQFRHLAAYARLKRDLAGTTDDLIAVFEAGEAPGADRLDRLVYPLIARLARRDEATVRATANALWPAPASPAFASAEPLQQLWDALQVVARFGVPVAALVAWTRIASAAVAPAQRFEIARDLRETVRARFAPEAWQRVARSIFDPLRQRQRDALAAYIMHRHGFARLEQLYEFFLVDPGMEPVVQTSRIRQAIAAVQLFIQRCLLNLEPQVHPSMINTRHWEWMKRYRVWEANRKIFLFPENWLEPEFRDDKTHLFRELESDLLQGDVSDDLVEDAFLGYLRKLEELARLNIVGMAIENKEGSSNALHVIGRTYSTPHKVFYRRYAHGMWTPWEPVTAEIQGEHLAPVVWRQRLHLFWVTFMDRSDPNAQVSGPNARVSDPNILAARAIERSPALDLSLERMKINDIQDERKLSYLENPILFEVYQDSGSDTARGLAEMSIAEVASSARAGLARKMVEVHLHWSEYLQGEWSTRESGEYATPVVANVPLDFDPEKVFIHVSTEPAPEGESRGVKVHLGSPINAAFYLAGRNAQPRRVNVESPPHMPYTRDGVRANRYTGSGQLRVTYTRRITQEDGGARVSLSETPTILGQGQAFTLLPAANALALSDQEIASLVSPFFYQGDEHTFFVQPNLVERTIRDWQEWLPPPPAPQPGMVLPERLPDLVKPMVPRPKLPIPVDPADPLWQVPIHPDGIFKVRPEQDWLVNPATALQFGGELIGPAGRAGLAVVPAAAAGEIAAGGGITVDVGAGSQLAPDTALAAVPSSALAASGLVQAAGGLNVVGQAGLNAALVKNLGQRLG